MTADTASRLLVVVQSGNLKIPCGTFGVPERDVHGRLRRFESGDEAPAAQVNVPGLHDVFGEGCAFDHPAPVMDWHLDFPAVRCRSAPQFAEAWNVAASRRLRQHKVLVKIRNVCEERECRVFEIALSTADP